MTHGHNHKDAQEPLAVGSFSRHREPHPRVSVAKVMGVCAGQWLCSEVSTLPPLVENCSLMLFLAKELFF